MDAFLDAVTWHHMVFIRSARGDFYRVWFEDMPLMQRLIGDEAEYREPLAELRRRLEQSAPGVKT